MPARVLIVDDTIPSVKVLSAKLAGEYYEVLTATDGPTALDVIDKQDPDLVLLDVMMPGMDGFEVCRRIKDNPDTAHIPVVMVTALSDNADRVAGLTAGADDFLTKPVSDTLLFARVASLVRLKRMLDQWRLRQETSQDFGFASAAQQASKDRGDVATVLLVDDSQVECANIQEVLAADDDDVTVLAGDPKDLVSSAMDRGADVLILSLTEDDDRPLRLASQIRSIEQTRQLPILLIGDEEDMEQLLKALEIGVNDFVIRPIDPNELLARVRTQVRRKRYQDRLQEHFVHSLSLALTDSLTGLHNRHYLTSHLDAVMRRMVASGKPLSLLMIDIDHFKRVNDGFGHIAGDKALAEIGQIVARNIRGFDMAARYGGEEFVVVMPDTELNIAESVADRLRERIAESPIQLGGDSVTLTVSVGVAPQTGPDDSPKELLARADKAMYAAKEGGRNRVVAAAAAESKPADREAG